jgi:predicted metalloprotease
METTGRTEYDETVRHALAEVSTAMGRPVGATLKFMGQYNAHVNPSLPMTIAFGKELLDELYAGGDFQLRVTCIAAHEVGHILQFEDGYFDIALTDATVRRNELMADAFAGACLAFIVNGGQKIDRGVLEEKRNSVQAAFQLMFQLGDDYFNSPDHHGTSQERLDAVDAGYTFSNEIASSGPLGGDISKDIMDKARIIAAR